MLTYQNKGVARQTPTCTFCGKVYAHKSSLSKHIRDNHSDQASIGSIQCIANVTEGNEK